MQLGEGCVCYLAFEIAGLKITARKKRHQVGELAAADMCMNATRRTSL